MMHDLRLAVRSLLGAPGYFVGAGFTFGVAIAANSAICSVVYAVLLQPLPIREADRLVVWWERNKSQQVVEVSYRNFQDWQASSRTLSHVAAFGSSPWPLGIEAGGEPVRIATIGVSTGFFQALGARPLLGRFFSPADERPNPIRPLVISHRLWQSRFGGDRNIVGRSVGLGAERARVIGVAEAELDFPRGVEAWIPVEPVLADTTGIDGFRDIGVLFGVGRLRDGLSPVAAASDLERVAADAAAAGGHRFGSAVRVTEFLDYQLGTVRPALTWLSVAALILLLIACGNLAALFLTRVTQQSRPQAIRRALGANGWTLWRPWMYEALLVSVVGGVAGLIAAHWLLAVVNQLAPDDVPRLTGMSINMPVSVATFGVCVMAALISVTVPIALQKRAALIEDLDDAAHGTEATQHAYARSLLLAIQVGLAIVLTTAAGLMLRSYINLRQLDLGFVAEQVVTLEIDSLRGGSAHNEWLRELLARVEQLRLVDVAGAVNVRPLALDAIGTDATVVLEGQPDSRQSVRLNPTVNYQSATPGYFPTMRIRLEEGRLFTAEDHAHAPRVVIVGRSTARRLWPGERPLGRRLSIPSLSKGEPSATWRTVVGVVEDVRYRGLDDVRLDVYEPAAQSTVRAGHLVVRSSRNAVAVVAAVQAEARRLEPGAMFSGITTMEAVVDRAMAVWRLSVWIFGLFAMAALILSCAGLFSTVSLDTTRRGKEIALRMALGAGTFDIARTVVAATGLTVLMGTTVGLIVAMIGTRVMTHLLFGVQPLDAITYAGVVCLMVVTVITGCALPAYRAIRIDPAQVLKSS